MKKSELRELVLEAIGGYENKDGKLVPHSDKFDNTKLSSILMRVAKRRPEEEDSVKGKKPMYEEEQGGGNLTATEIAEFVKNALNLRDYDVTVRLNPTHSSEITLTIKRDPSVEDFNTIIKYLEDNGYTVDQMQSRREGESDDDRYYFPRIVFR